MSPSDETGGGRVGRGSEYGTTEDPLIGTTVRGHYVKERLHDGGGGGVYLVEYRGDERVMKTLVPSVASVERFAARFEREVMILSKLRDVDEVPQLLGDGQRPDGMRFIIMERINGITLGRALKVTRFQPRRGARIGARIAGALDRVHAVGVVHRDFKARNIMLCDEDQVALLDFGLAAVEASTLTATELAAQIAAASSTFERPGNSESPQAKAGEPPAPSDDVYDLGLILKAMFGPRPPRQLQLAVDRCLAQDAAERYRASELHELLAAYARGPRLAGSVALGAATLAVLGLLGAQFGRHLVDSPVEVRTGGQDKPAESTQRLAVAPNQPVAAARFVSPPAGPTQRRPIGRRPVPPTNQVAARNEPTPTVTPSAAQTKENEDTAGYKPPEPIEGLIPFVPGGKYHTINRLLDPK